MSQTHLLDDAGKCIPDCPACPKEKVNHPQHYGGNTPYEVIKVLFAWGLEKDFCLGNVVKYVARAGKKGDLLEDLEKAAFYLNYKIKRLREACRSSS